MLNVQSSSRLPPPQTNGECLWPFNKRSGVALSRYIVHTLPLSTCRGIYCPCIGHMSNGENIVSIQGWILSPYRDEYCLHTGVNIVATPPAQFSDTRGPTVAGAAPCRARAPRRGRARPRPRSRWPTEVTMEARTSLAPAAGPRYSEASAGTSQTPRCCRSGHTQMFHLPFKNIWCQDQKYFLPFYQSRKSYLLTHSFG